MKKFVLAILLAEAFAVTTFGLGWWSVPLVAALYALLAKSDRSALVAAACAAGGWLTLLLLDMAKGPVLMMGTRLGGAMGLPPAALYAVTILFPALMAWSAAILVPRVRAASR
jgi:hypothetical protein